MNESRVVIATFDTGSNPRRHRATGGVLQCVEVPPDGAVPDRSRVVPRRARHRQAAASSSRPPRSATSPPRRHADGRWWCRHGRRLRRPGVARACPSSRHRRPPGHVRVLRRLRPCRGRASRRTTRHHPLGRNAEQLNDRYDAFTVDADAIYVHDGNVWTSAGVTAGIDLALALVADDHGNNAAATVARQLVVYLRTLRRASPILRGPRRPGRRHQPVRDRSPAFATTSPTTCP